MNNQDDGKLLEILQQEKFLAFFDFCKIGENGESELDGLCKVAQPQNIENLDYISLTFIFDTPSEGKQALARRIMEKFTTDVFRKNLSNVYAVTNVPAMVRQTENYIHQIDIIFASKVTEDIREVVKKIVYIVRTFGGLGTEVPQWWDETSETPKQTEAEKANWSARIKAFLGIKSRI